MRLSQSSLRQCVILFFVVFAATRFTAAALDSHEATKRAYQRRRLPYAPGKIKSRDLFLESFKRQPVKVDGGPTASFAKGDAVQENAKAVRESNATRGDKRDVSAVQTTQQQGRRPVGNSAGDWPWSNSGSGSTSTSGSGSGSTPGLSHQFTFYNNCTEDIWVAILGNPGFEIVAQGGFHMARAGPPITLPIPVGWEGRVWARPACHFEADGACNPPYAPCCASGSCLMADGRFGLYCAESGLAPTSLIEMSLDNASPMGPYDVYDVSLVDGWSIPLGIYPVPGTYNPSPDPGITAPWCMHSGCLCSPDCPAGLGVNGSGASCWSPCQAAVNNNNDMNDILKSCCVCTTSDPNCDCASTTDPFSSYFGCCAGAYGCTPYHTPTYPNDTVCDPWSSDPTRAWAASGLDYIGVVQHACPLAYAWQFDDKAATFNCRKTSGVVDYRISFTTMLR